VVVLDARVVKGAGGGPDKTIINSPRYLEGTGYRMLCAYMHAPDDAGFEQLRRKARERSVDLISVPDHGPWDWRVVPRLLEVCRRERVAVWHGHEYKSNLLGLILRRYWPMRLVTTVHGWVEHTWRTPLYYCLDRVSLRFYEQVYCVSEDLYHACRAAGVTAARCEVLENGIDLTEYSRRQTVAEARRSLGLSPHRPLIGAVGRLSPEKGFDLLIKALAELNRGGLDADLVILGDGGQRAALQALANQLGLQDRVHLVGWQANLIGWYEAMEVFTLSSLREGLPNVLLEALALEVPVVATRVAGVPRVVADGENGLLVEPGSVAALTGALARLMRDPHLQGRFRAAGRRAVEACYSFAARIDRLRSSYNRLLGRRGAGLVLGPCPGTARRPA
jgi:glycosyltransferase involved in cell wall biosynthesis